MMCSIFAIILLSVTSNISAHSGRTDSHGGHKDKNNVSGLGGYHYHCNGYGPHLHDNGVCPYAAKKVETQVVVPKPKVAASTSAPVIEEKKQDIIEVAQVTINQDNICIAIGEEKGLSYLIKPMNVNDARVEWKSNNEEIVKISDNGKITGIKEGETTVRAIASNGKQDIKIVKVQSKKNNVEKIKDEKVNSHIPTAEKLKTNTKNNENNADIFIGLGTIGVGALIYFIYRGMKK
ncbi:MAG: Ig-like domain-containing protein [Clostridia bacterium]|nr:Ig-like domain-containing protein [Clostridia bacterium]